MESYCSRNNCYKLTTYWLKQQFGGKYKWTTLEHNGVLFPPEYKPLSIPIIYKGEQIILEPEIEAIALIYSKYTDTEYVNNKIFRRNFWNDFKKMLGKSHTIQDLENCDFKLFNEYLLREKERKDNMTKEEKEELKKQKEEEDKPYRYAIVDGKEQPVGNFRIEPMGIFIGRGCHPKLGKIKQKIIPEDITLNLSKDAKIPELPDQFKSNKWGKIIHDRSVEWLASWKDDISGKTKYVWLGAHSEIKGKNDMEKFDLARKLKKKIKTIREKNEENFKSPDIILKQIATALYFIDKFALRVGNEKGSDEADTVGVTSLRVEHIELVGVNMIKLDFLGKDSVRYLNTVTVEPVVYINVSEFMKNKERDDNLFDKIIPNDLNKYLQNFMKGLTAKVFRTYNASNVFQKELKKISVKYENIDTTDKINLLLDGFNKANAKVATLCNHQKNISKSFADQLDKINDRLKKLKSKLKKIKKNSKNNDRINKIKIKIEELKGKKGLKIEMKNISLGTSKINYIDPRITVAFMKKHNLPVDKIFNKTLQEKFKWAFGVSDDYTF